MARALDQLPGLPSLEAIRAERARRAPLWYPQHRDGYKGGEKCPDPVKCRTVPHVLRLKRTLANGETEEYDQTVATGGGLCRHPQALAFYSLADTLGFGGSSGSGKSALLCGVCLTQSRSAIIFRKELSQVKGPEGLVNETVKIVANRGGKLNRTDLIWSDLPGGRSLEFEGVKNPGDEHKQQGHAHDTTCFDEATEFPEHVVRWLTTWNRSSTPGQRTRVIFTFNPPTATRGQWVKKYFAAWLDPKHPNPAQSGELRWYTTIDGQEVERPNGKPFEHTTKQGRVETIRPKSRTFIPGRLDDNAYLRDTDYRDTLQALPEPYRSMYLYGDMDAQGTDDPFQVIKTAHVLAAQERWLDRERPDIPMSACGADIARGGQARTVFGPRWANYYGQLTAYPGAETPTGKHVADRLIAVLSHEPECPALAEIIKSKTPDAVPVARCLCPILEEFPVVGMDPIGVGTAAVDACRARGIEVIGLDGSDTTQRPNDTDRSGRLTFANARSRMWWQFAESLDLEKGDDVALPLGHEIVAELCSVRYEIKSGRIALRPKAEAEKVIGHSLDLADAIIYASAVRPFKIGYRSLESREGAPDFGGDREDDFEDSGGGRYDALI